MELWLELYKPAIIASAILCVNVLILSLTGAYWGFVRGKELPGDNLVADYDNLGFRALRTYYNAVENLPALALTFILSMIVGVPAMIVNISIVAHVSIRIIYGFVYYFKIGAQAGGPRSWLYILGWLINIGLAGCVIYFAIY